MDSNEGNLGCITTLIIIAIAGWFIYKADQNYKYGEKPPFWKGTSFIQVCKVPYYSSDECYRLNVTLIDKNIARINFDNGGYVYTHDVTCYFTTTYLYGNEHRYVFCRSWDNDDQQWDFAPLDTYY
jgi:hypothetical protein